METPKGFTVQIEYAPDIKRQKEALLYLLNANDKQSGQWEVSRETGSDAPGQSKRLTSLR